MNRKEAVTDAALVGVAGYGAAKVMGKATTFMYEQQTEERPSGRSRRRATASPTTSRRRRPRRWPARSSPTTRPARPAWRSTTRSPSAGSPLHGRAPPLHTLRRRCSVRPVDGGARRRNRQPAAWTLHMRGAGAPVKKVRADEVRVVATGTLDDSVRRVLTHLAPDLTDDAPLRLAVLRHAQELAVVGPTRW